MTTYIHHDTASARALVPRLAELYGLVYSEPPYEEGPEQVERFRLTFADEIDRAGFTLVAAEDGDRLVGAAYGWTMPANSWWSRADRQPPKVVYEHDKFAVMEWIVDSGWRRRGVGAELLRRLLKGRPERYATLASDPRSAARQIYAKTGWRQVSESTLSWGPSMDILVLEM